MRRPVIQMANSLMPLNPAVKSSGKEIPVGPTEKTNTNGNLVSLPLLPEIKHNFLTQDKINGTPEQLCNSKKSLLNGFKFEDAKQAPASSNELVNGEVERESKPIFENMLPRETRMNGDKIDSLNATRLNQQIPAVARNDLSRNRKLEKIRLNTTDYSELLDERDKEIQEKNEDLRGMSLNRTELMNQVTMAYYRIEELKAQIISKNELVKESKKHENVIKFEMQKLQQESERLKERCDNTLREMEARIRAKDSAIAKLQADQERFLTLRDEKVKENESLMEKLEQKEHQAVELKTKLSLIGNWSVRT